MFHGNGDDEIRSVALDAGQHMDVESNSVGDGGGGGADFPDGDSDGLSDDGTRYLFPLPEDEPGISYHRRAFGQEDSVAAPVNLPHPPVAAALLLDDYDTENVSLGVSNPLADHHLDVLTTTHGHSCTRMLKHLQKHMQDHPDNEDYELLDLAGMQKLLPYSIPLKLAGSGIHVSIVTHTFLECLYSLLSCPSLNDGHGYLFPSPYPGHHAPTH